LAYEANLHREKNGSKKSLPIDLCKAFQFFISMLNNINKEIKVPNDFPMQISGSSVWTGAEMQQDQSWKIEWSQSQLNELNQAAHHFLSLGKPLEQITKEDFPLPTIHTLINEILKELLAGAWLCTAQGDSCSRAWY
jgi:hypothetical protein